MPLEPTTVEPAQRDLKILRGSSFQTLITLYEDEAHTKPWDFTGFTPELFIDGVITLTPGAGLTVTAKSGLVAVSMTPAQTAAPGAVSKRWYLKLTKAELALYILHGQAAFLTP